MTLPALALLLAFTQPPADTMQSLMAPGVSLELAELRSRQLSDVRYDLQLDLTARDSATGTVAVSFNRLLGGDVILDFRGLHTGRTTANGQPVTVVANGAHIRVPESALRTGHNTVTIDFTAAIAPAGASVIRFHDERDNADYLYTLLVPADANQLFPCFDQPDLKARVTLSLVTPPGWTAVANGPLATSDARPGARSFRFSETEPISTYLIAFAAGPWATETRIVDGRAVTLYVRASRKSEVEADTLIATNVRALAWLERYFDTPYPFGKFDFVLAPAFPFGGMEHPGAVFYGEDRFIFRERPTLTQLISRRSLIYHEVAHQWFGDLVTMRWFDDLWLKEGFATYMAAKMQAELEPDSEAWKTFHLRNKPLAYGVDATPGTTPVWQRLANLDQAKSNYGPIVYNKAPSVLRQLEYLVGEDAFRTGVREFLGRHRFGNASWRDLLGAIGGAAGRSLDTWGEHYILRPGMPVIQQELHVVDGRIQELVLSQSPARGMSGAGAWPIRTELLLWYENAPAVRIPVELTSERTVVSRAAGLPAPAFVYANAGDHAYALTIPDARSVAWLEQNIGRIDDATLRAMLWGSLWDMVRDARMSPECFIGAAVRELPRERDEQIASSLLGQLGRASSAYLTPDQRTRVLPAVEAMLRRVADDGARGYGLRKLHFDALVRIAGTHAALAHLDSLLDNGRAAGEPLQQPSRWAMVGTLLEHAAPTAESRFAAESVRDTTTESARRAFVAGAARPDPAVKQRYFGRYLNDTELNEDWATSSLGNFNSPGHSELTLPYLRPALDTLPWIQRNRRIFFLGSWLGSFLGGQRTSEAWAVVQQYLVENPGLPDDLRLKVLQAADELERTVRIRAEFGGATRP